MARSTVEICFLFSDPRLDSVADVLINEGFTVIRAMSIPSGSSVPKSLAVPAVYVVHNRHLAPADILSAPPAENTIVLVEADDTARIRSLLHSGFADVLLLNNEPDYLAYRLSTTVARLELQKDNQRLAKQLSEIQNITKSGYWEYDPVADKYSGSEMCAKIYGMDNIDLTINSLQLFELIHPDHRQKFLSDLEAAVKSPDLYQTEVTLMLPDGGEKVFHLARYNVFDSQNKLVHAYGIIQDITHWSKTRSQLSATLSRHKSLLSAIPDLMFLFSSDGRFLDVHFPDQKQLFAPPAVFLGKHASEILPPDIASLTLQKIESLMQTAEPQVYRYPLAIDNEPQHFEARMVKCGTDALCIVRNISHRVQSENKIIDKQRQLEQISKELRSSNARLIETNKALKDSEQRYRMLIEAADDRIAFTDRSGKIVFANTAFYSLLGYTKAQYEQQQAEDGVFHQSDKGLIVSNLKEFRETGRCSWEYRARHSNGQYLNMLAKAVAVVNDNNEAIGSLIIIRDITSLKQAQEEAKRHNDALMRAQESIQQANTELIERNALLQLAENQLMDANLELEARNRELTESREKLKTRLNMLLSPELEWKGLSLLELFQADDLQLIQDAFSSALGIGSLIVDSEGTPVTEPANWSGFCQAMYNSPAGRSFCQASFKKISEQSRHKRKAFVYSCGNCGFSQAGAPIIVGNEYLGTWLVGFGAFGHGNLEYMQKHIETLCLPGGNALLEGNSQLGDSEVRFRHIVDLLWIIASEMSVMGYNNLKLARLLEEQRMQQAELREAFHRAEASDRLKTSFLANMSHEIRTPMNAIMGFSDLLLHQDFDEFETKSYLEVIYSNSADLLNLINDILDISLIESGQIKIMPRQFNLNRLIRELFDNHSRRIRLLQKDLDFRIINRLEPDDYDLISDPFRITQIVNNLLNNSVKFTHEGYVEMCVEKSGNDILCFRVSDTGIGIAPDMQKLIFERFVQTPETSGHKYGGTGLGLAICRGLAEALRGTIELHSVPGEGTVVSLCIPFVVNEKQVEPVKSSVPPKNHVLRGKTILLVEDTAASVEYIQLALTDSGADLLLAETGDEALKVFNSRTDIDLILMDIRLPDINGLELTKTMKASRPNLPIIAQTAYAMDQDRLKAEYAGCDDYLMKPLRKEALMEKLSSFLAKE